MMPPSYWHSIILEADEVDQSKYDATLLKIIEEIQRDASNDALLRVERSIVGLLNFK